MNSVTKQLISGARNSQQWVRDRPWSADLLVSVTVFVITLTEVAATNKELGTRDSDGLDIALIIIGSGALFWRRRAPITVLAIVTAAMCMYWIAGYGTLLPAVGLPALYSVVVHADQRRAAWAAVTLSSVVLVGTASARLLNPDAGYATADAFSMSSYITGSIIAGAVVRNRGQIFVDAQRRAAEAEAAQQEEAYRAVQAERIRIAREMHDVVAHGMSVISVQAAAGQQIAHRDPDRAVEVFATIEATGRESLTEMRRMLGVLRDDGGVPTKNSPLPSVDDLSGLVDQCNTTGVATEFQVDGDPVPLPPGIGLAAYRIVQEALTNVLKHAGQRAAATVELCYHKDAVTVTVRDSGRGAVSSLTETGAGKGLIGMRERVEVYDGRLTAGPRPGGGYEVSAWFPINGGADRPAVASAEGAR